MAVLIDIPQTGYTGTQEPYGDRWRGQSFKLSQAAILTSVKVWICPNYPAGYTFTLEIYECSDPYTPIGEALASVDKAGADIPAGTHLEEWVLPSVSVSADKQYCWLIKSTSPGAYNSFSMYYQYKYPYADGQMVATNDAGVTWFNWSNYDFAFQVLGDYVSPPSGKPILPRKMAYSGYHCFIEQYQRRRIAGLIPFKLPDGTLYPV